MLYGRNKAKTTAGMDRTATSARHPIDRLAGWMKIALTCFVASVLAGLILAIAWAVSGVDLGQHQNLLVNGIAYGISGMIGISTIVVMSCLVGLEFINEPDQH